MEKSKAKKRTWAAFIGSQRGKSRWNLPNAEKLSYHLWAVLGKLQYPIPSTPRYGTRAIKRIRVMGIWVEPRITHSSLY